MKILVCGGRDYSDMAKVFQILDTLTGVSVVVHGAARGADTLAGLWAASKSLKEKPYPADWNRYGKRAGPIRNLRMLDDNPDIELVVAFPGGAGTENMIALAEARGIKILRVA